MNDQTSARPARILPKLEQFPGRASDTIRFGDLDPQGHVNNTVFATYFETGRVMLLREPGNLLNPPGATSVLARLDISFLREMHCLARSRSEPAPPGSGARPTRSCKRSSTRANAPRPRTPPW